MNVLLTSAGRRSYLVEYFRTALAGAGEVIACNSSKDSTALMTADRWIESPLIYSDEYVPFLLDVVRKHRIGLIVPLFDIDLPVLARHREAFEWVGARVLVSALDVVEICNDKVRTHDFLRSAGIPTPATFSRLDGALAHLEAGTLCYPLVVKPRWGMGSLSIFVAETEQELRVFHAKARREVFATYLKYESQADPETCVILQEYVAGDEYGLDVVNDLSGRYVTTAVKRKLAMRSGETDAAVTVDVPALRALGEQLSAALGHIGNLDVDVLERDGRYLVLEMNARLGGGYPFSHLAGMNLPSELLRWCSGVEPDADRLQVQHGIVGFKAVDPRVSPIHVDDAATSHAGGPK